MTERVDQRPPQGHGLESPGHMGQTWKVLNARICVFGSCRDLFCLPLFWSLEEEVRGSHGASVFTTPLSVWMEVQCDHVAQAVCAHTHPGQDREVPATLYGARPREGLTPRKVPPASLSSKGFVLLQTYTSPAAPCPIPPIHFSQFLLTILHSFYSRRKEGCFPLHQHVLP